MECHDAVRIHGLRLIRCVRLRRHGRDTGRRGRPLRRLARGMGHECRQKKGYHQYLAVHKRYSHSQWRVSPGFVERERPGRRGVSALSGRSQRSGKITLAARYCGVRCGRRSENSLMPMLSCRCNHPARVLRASARRASRGFSFSMCREQSDGSTSRRRWGCPCKGNSGCAHHRAYGSHLPGW